MVLKTVLRQKDERLRQLLNDIRYVRIVLWLWRKGKCSEQSLQLIEEMSNHDVDAMLKNEVNDHDVGEVVEEKGEESMAMESVQ